MKHLLIQFKIKIGSSTVMQSPPHVRSNDNNLHSNDQRRRNGFIAEWETLNTKGLDYYTVQAN